MYTTLWNKYLPIIRILFKRSINEPQTLSLNISDFERAGVARKTGNKFMLKFVKARVDNVIINSPIASNFASALLQDPVIKELLLTHEYHLTMNTKFLLTIVCIPSTDEAAPKEENDSVDADNGQVSAEA